MNTMLVWHTAAKQHSYENVVRLLPCLRKRQKRRPSGKLHSHKPQCDSPIVPPFHLPTIEVINKIGGPEVDDLHATDVIFAQGKNQQPRWRQRRTSAYNGCHMFASLYAIIENIK